MLIADWSLNRIRPFLFFRAFHFQCLWICGKNTSGVKHDKAFVACMKRQLTLKAIVLIGNRNLEYIRISNVTGQMTTKYYSKLCCV